MVEQNVEDNTLQHEKWWSEFFRGETMYRFVLIRSYFRPKEGWYIRVSRILEALKELDLDPNCCEGEGCSPMVAEILDHKMQKGAYICEL